MSQQQGQGQMGFNHNGFMNLFAQGMNFDNFDSQGGRSDTPLESMMSQGSHMQNPQQTQNYIGNMSRQHPQTHQQNPDANMYQRFVQSQNQGGHMSPNMQQSIMSQLNQFSQLTGSNSGMNPNQGGGMGQQMNPNSKGHPQLANIPPEMVNQLMTRFKNGQISREQLNQILSRTKEVKQEETARSPMGPGMPSSSPAQNSQSSPNGQSPSPTPQVGQKRKIDSDHNARKKPKKAEEGTSGNASTEEQTIKTLLDNNFQIIQQIRQNLFQGHIRDNLELITKFRDNIIRVLTCMSTMPGIMSQMPPIPVKLNTICMPSNTSPNNQQNGPGPNPSSTNNPQN